MRGKLIVPNYWKHIDGNVKSIVSFNGVLFNDPYVNDIRLYYLN